MIILKNTVLVFSDNIKRDFESLWLICQLLKRNNIKTFILSRLTLNLFLQYFTPSILVLPTCKLLCAEQFKLLKTRKCIIIILEADANYKVLKTIEYVHPDIDYSFIDKILLWNEWTKNWLNNNRRVDHRKLIVVGLPRNQLNINTEDNAHLKKGIINIGILTRFEQLNVFDRRPPQELFTDKGGLTDIKLKRFHVDIDAMSIVVKLMNSLSKSGHNVSIRVHPNENTSTYQSFIKNNNLSISVDSTRTISEWLTQVDLVIGPFNSALVDSYIAKVPAICIDNMLDHKLEESYLHILESVYDSCYMPCNYDDLINLIYNNECVFRTSKLMDDVLLNMYSYSERQCKPIDNVVEIITDEINCSQNKSIHETLIHLTATIYLAILECFMVFKYMIKFLIQKPNSKEIFDFHYLNILHKPSQFIQNIFSSFK